MPFSTGSNSRIRTNSQAELAYNALNRANFHLSTHQLRLSTGKRINNPGDDVAGYITSRALQARNGLLKAAMNIIGDAKNLSNIAMDGYEGIAEMLIKIREGTAAASSGATGTDEKVALAKAAYRMAQQIQTITDSTVFGGRQLIDSTYSSNFLVGTDAINDLLTIAIDLTTSSPEFNVESRNFDVKAEFTENFAGITGLDLTDLDEVSATDLGIFEEGRIENTIKSLADALDNITKVNSYLGGVANRLISQEQILEQQTVNYNAAISRIEDTDVAKSQLELIKQQFLQQASITSLSQANQNPTVFLQLLRQ